MHPFTTVCMLKEYLHTSIRDKWLSLNGKAKQVAILGHISPDGDAMGSTLAMAHYLRRKGKHVQVIVPTSYPDFLAWLPGAGDVLVYEYAKQAVYQYIADVDLFICMDFNSVKRLEQLSHIIQNHRAPMITIDHHLSPDEDVDLLVSDPSASSTCEIVFSMLYQLEGLDAFTEEMAECVYCGMMTDTGSFTYNSNRSELFYIISLLLSKGIDKDKIYRNVYHDFSVNRLRLEGYILHKKMQYFQNDHAALFTLTREEMKEFQYKKGDAEGFVNLPLQIRGTRLSISLREDTEKDLVRVSLRSVDDFPCNRMAEDFFNGGGHLNASGGHLSMTMDQAVEVAQKAIEAYRPLLRSQANVIKN